MALQAKVGHFARPAAGTTNTVVTGMGFQPTALIFLAAHGLTAGTWRAAMETAIGWAAPSMGDNPVTLSASISQASNNAAATAANMSIQGRMTLRNSGGTVQAEAATVAFDADGFTVDWTNSPYDGEQELVAYLALGGDALAEAATYAYSRSDLMQPRPKKGHALKGVPSATLLLTGGGAPQGQQSFGAAAGGAQWALSLAQAIGVSPSATSRLLTDDRAIELLDASMDTRVYGASVAEVTPIELTLESAWGQWQRGSLGSGTSNFNTPKAMAAGPSGYVYVADTGNYRIVKLDQAGAYVSHLALPWKPKGVAVDSGGAIYVCGESGLKQTTVRKYNSAFVQQWSITVADFVDGLATNGAYVWVVGQYTIYRCNCSDGAAVSTFGSKGGGQGQFNSAWAACWDGAHLFVSDIQNMTIQKFLPDGTFVASWSTRDSAAGINYLTRGLAVDEAGNIWGTTRTPKVLRQYAPDGTLLQSRSTSKEPHGIAAFDARIIYSEEFDHRITAMTVPGGGMTVNALYLRGLQAAAGVATKATGAAPAAQALGVKGKPKAALFATQADTAIDTAASHMRLSVGVSDGTNHRAIAAQAEDNVATANADAVLSTTRALIVANNTTPASDAEAVVSSFGADVINLTWNPNNAVATRIAWLVFGQLNPFVGAATAELDAQAIKLGNPVNLTGDIDAAAVVEAITFGNVGNLTGGVVDAAATLSATGITFDRPLTGVVDAAASISALGIKFNRNLTGTIDAALMISGAKLGLPWFNTGQIDAVAEMTALGIKFDRPLTGSIPAAASLDAYFHITLPRVRAPDEDELAGTVNWHINPSAERNLIGWDPEGSATVGRTSAEQWDGAWGVSTALPASNGIHGLQMRSVAGLELTGLDANGNMRVVWGQARLKGPAGTPLRIWSRAVYQDGSISVGEVADITLTDGWLPYYAPALTLDPLKTLKWVECVVGREQNRARLSPSFEDGSWGSYWGSSGGATLARVTSEFKVGGASLQVTPTATSLSGTYYQPVLASRPQVVAGEVVFVGVWVKAPVGMTNRLETQCKTAGDSAVTTFSVDFAGTGDWQLVWHTFTVPATATNLVMLVRRVGTAPVAPYWVDGLMVALGSDVVPYNDGEAVTFYADGAQIEEDRGQGPTAWVTGAYGRETGRWTGVPDASMSIRDPLAMIVHGIGRNGDATIRGRLYRATYDNIWLEDISEGVIEGRVTMSPERETTWTFDATLHRDAYTRLTPDLDWLAPVLTITYPDGTVKEGQLGLYFLVPSAEKRGEYGGTVQISAFDPLWLLGTQAFTERFVARPGRDRLGEVRRIIDGGVLTGGDGTGVMRRFAIPDSGKEFKRGREWDRKTNRLELCNEILESTGFYPLWSTATGVITSRKRGGQRLANSAPVRAWTAHIPPGTLVDPWIPRLSGVQGEVVGEVATKPLALDNIDEILMINDDPRLPRIHTRGKVKRRRRHRRGQQWIEDRRKGKTRKLYAPLVDDEATAQEVAEALADDLSCRVEHLTLAVLPDPTVDYINTTCLLAIWDSLGDPVGVGQYVFRQVQWGFTPHDALQVMDLDWVDGGDAEISSVLQEAVLA